jgi:hypothetical protein
MRTRGIKRGIGLIIVFTVTWSAMPTLGQIPIHDEAMEFKAASDVIHSIETECVAIIETLETAEMMESIGRSCEDRVFNVIDVLEEWRGAPIDFIPQYKCVYNEIAQHTTCFDPVFITGSG